MPKSEFPLTYQVRIDAAVNCVFIRHFEGYLRGEGLQATRSIVDNDQYRPGMYVLKDYSDIVVPADYDFDFARTQAVAFAEIDKAFGADCRIALVADRPLTFGLLRQMSTLNDSSVIARQAFRNVMDAARWLGLPEGYTIRFSD